MKLALIILMLLIAIPWVAPYDPLEQRRDLAGAAPGVHHWLGTDDYGRDVFSRFLYGGRWSILTGAAATLLVLLLSWILGGLAGYFGGWVDQLVMRVAEVFLVLPWLYLLLAARSLLPLSLEPRAAFLAMLLLVALVSWARPARLVRGLVLSIKERAYVEAARGFGVPGWTILLHHILPDTQALLVTQALILLPRFVLAEVTLSFLGLGTGEPDPSWGALLIPLKQAWMLSSEWWRVLPAMIMVPLFVGFAVAARRAERRSTLR